MDEKLLKALNLCFDMPPEEAVAYMESQGFAVTHDWRKALKAIEEHCFTVSKVTSADALQTIHDELNKAMTQGMSWKQFQDNTGTLLTDKGFGLKADGSSYRFELIYRMNMQTAYQAGQFWEMEAANDEFPYREFIAIQDKRTTSGCMTLDGSVFLSSDPFYLSNQTPRHFRCRSTWRSLTAEQAKGRVKTGKDFKSVKPEQGFGLNPKEAKYKPDLGKYENKIGKQVAKGIEEFKPVESKGLTPEEILNSPETIAELKKAAENFTPNYFEEGSAQSMPLKIIAKIRGYDQPPKVLNKKDFDALGDDDYMTVYRGMSDIKFYDTFKKGEYWAGTGRQGSGIYTATNYGDAVEYAGKTNALLKIKVPKNLKIGKEEDFNNQINDIYEKAQEIAFKKAKVPQDVYDKYLNSELTESEQKIIDNYHKILRNTEAELIPKYLSDTGTWAAHNGYDAYTAETSYTDEILIILNRSKVIVQQENMKIK